jgi:hypothetical protein
VRMHDRLVARNHESASSRQAALKTVRWRLFVKPPSDFTDECGDQ